MGEKQNWPFQLPFNNSLKVNFHGSRVTSDAGLILVRQLDEQLGFGDLVRRHLTDSRRGRLSDAAALRQPGAPDRGFAGGSRITRRKEQRIWTAVKGVTERCLRNRLIRDFSALDAPERAGVSAPRAPGATQTTNPRKIIS
jgi:hypothetical protein